MGASTSKVFVPDIRELSSFAEFIHNEDIKNEPMFYNCDLRFAYLNGGSITRSFIDALPGEWKTGKAVFNSRVHMLMPGWYPAIPGWHHDDIARPAGSPNGQPDYDNQLYHSEHIMGLVNADICPTGFITTACEMPAVPEGDLIYRAWHKEIEKQLEEGILYKCAAKDRTLIYFDCHTFHAGTKAVAGGWRWFGRVSRYTDRVNSITNEIRRNAQVYLEFPMEGW
jgi:hypothetical protein